ncbi:MAG TPA: tail fiber protein, partial [Pyrinomonadaceae bacterium]|nr:tail fiber protein [Pyrinomonadaceae bacterium]
PPVGWALCNGQSMPISENEVLFQIIGTTYGGDGEETFNLPNLQSRVPLHQGTGLSGSTYQLGEQGGVESVTLTTQQIPVHSHVPLANSGAGGSASPTGNFWAANANTAAVQFTAGASTDTNMNNQTVGPSGGSQPHENRMPFLVITFAISLFGLFPSQN